MADENENVDVQETEDQNAAPVEEVKPEEEGSFQEQEEERSEKDENPMAVDLPEEEDSESEGADERLDAVEEQTPEAAELAAKELDFHGPLHLQDPRERIMTGAVSEEQAKEQEELLKNKPDDYVGEVTEAGFNEDGEVITKKRVVKSDDDVEDEDVEDEDVESDE